MIEGQATNEDFEPSLVNEDLKSEVGDPNIDLYNALKNMPTPSQSSSTDIDPASPIIITHNMNYENYPNQQSAELGPSSVSSAPFIDLAPEHESEANTSSIHETIKKLNPLPKIKHKRKITRSCETARVLTSIPEKTALENKENPNSQRVKANIIKQTKTKSAKRICFDNMKNSNDEHCTVCDELFSNSRSREPWIQYAVCLNWAHELCTPGNAVYVCQDCALNIV